MSNNLYKNYLQPEVLSKISNMELRAKLVVEGFITGLHKSPFHGFSVEFSQHRPYNAGDSLRFVDWKVYGRTDRYYIKQYEEETNLKSYILLDVSNSMNYASERISKLDYGKQLGAALTYLMLTQRDAVGMVLFDRIIRKMLPPRSTFSYLQPIIQELDRVKSGEDTRISTVLHQMAEQIKRRGLIIIISDLLDEPEQILSGLRHFRHNRHEVLVFHLLDPQEIQFDFGGDVIFEDMETGEKIKTFPWYIKKEYQAKINQFIAGYQRMCHENRIDYQLITTDLSLDKALMEYLIKRKRLY
jgi:uncharacterized protein (DUF58 family)